MLSRLGVFPNDLHRKSVLVHHDNICMLLVLIVVLALLTSNGGRGGVLSSNLFWTSGLWTYQPGSHRRKATQDF